MRIPLYLKLMASYLLVFGLVFVPTFFFLRTGLRDEVRSVLRAGLEADVAALSRQLSQVRARRLTQAIDVLVRTMPERVTVVDTQGHVLADTTIAGRKAKLENHLDRPEILDALAHGAGFATRFSKTTAEMRMYAAKRFPDTGTPKGVVRLSLSTDRADRAGANLSSFINHSGAVALSAAVLLSLLAAMVVSRPLRRIAQGARAFAAGDFGFEVDVRSRDELGEVAQALDELAQRLRGRLIEAGADRTTLRALLDDLPVGVVLFDADSRATVMNGKARTLLRLPPARELEVASGLTQLPDQAAIVARVLETTVSEETPLVWMPADEARSAPAQLIARWVAVAGTAGQILPAIILRERTADAPMPVALRTALSSWAKRLHEAVGSMSHIGGAATLAVATVADEIERAVPIDAPSAGGLATSPIGELCGRALSRVRIVCQGRSVEFSEELSSPAILVVDSGGRVERAIAWMLADAARRAEPGSRIVVRDEPSPTSVKLWIRVPAAAWDATGVAALLSPLGGDAGTAMDREITEAWVVAARA
jgi:HAMP domain-containing protein